MAEEMGHTANWEYDLVTNKLWGSPEGHRIYGLTPVDGEFSLEDLEACIPDRVRLRQALVDLISEGKEFNLECSVIPRDGSAQKMIHTVARLEKDAQGNPIKVLGIIQDITERKQAEDALREGEERYRYLFDSAPDGIKVVDETGVIVDCSQRALDLTGYTKEELLGRHITHDILPSSKSIFSAKFPLLQQNKPVEGELQITRKNGNIVWIWRKGFPLPDHAGKFAGALLYDRDITDRKLAESTLLRVNQKLNVLSQLTRQDLTTQIFVLNSYLEMAKNQATGQNGIIKNIESGERAVRSIKEITEFTKDYHNMGEKPPKYQNVKLSFLFGLSHISIGEIRHSLETENLEIFADPLLEKAFQGLLENSVQHGGHVSHIRVSHKITPEQVTIVFEDNGVGIPKEKKERIFLRGEAARASVRGLVFVREILDITGITITETGEPGKGARFEMAVPKGAWRITGNGA
jgi:PAS domain S-box-containing protein